MYMKKQGNNPLKGAFVRPEAGRKMLLIHKAGKREFSPNVAAGYFSVYL